MAAAAEAAAAEEEDKREVVYKTKLVEFFGRSTPIILQNGNGPCPLIAICNVMLLRNKIDLGVEESEVTEAKLLQLVAEKILDSNEKLQGMDDGYINNQRQNLTDALNLVHRLATGIDVNVLFRTINDFEFTPECALFDLLEIRLYHGWLLDPQDTETAEVIGSKSYNTLVADLVAFETRKLEEVPKLVPEEDCVDFAAATTATLGVPSPILSIGGSFEDPSVSPLDYRGRGDIEEAEELMRVLNLSRDEAHTAVDAPTLHADTTSSFDPEESRHKMCCSSKQMNLISSDDNPVNNFQGQAYTGKDTGTVNTAGNRSTGDMLSSFEPVQGVETIALTQNLIPLSLSCELNSCESSAYNDQIFGSGEGLSESKAHSEMVVSQRHDKLNDEMREQDSAVVVKRDESSADLDSSHGVNDLLDVSDEVFSSHAVREPLYEGEERILDSELAICETQEPIYEGEVVLAKQQADRVPEVFGSSYSSSNLSEKQGQLLKNFLENNASQLTVYGLFALQDGLKEHELCVFFRNNHFSTMFKYNNELYLLATDQGYINQSDLVWEKLNEVNGDSVFMTGSFKKFKVDDAVTEPWNQQNAITETAGYIASLEIPGPDTSNYNSDLQLADLQLAVALQQQELEQQERQQLRQQNKVSQQAQSSSQQAQLPVHSGLVTGSQVSRSSIPQKSESKKDKCKMM